MQATYPTKVIRDTTLILLAFTLNSGCSSAGDAPQASAPATETTVAKVVPVASPGTMKGMAAAAKTEVKPGDLFIAPDGTTANPGTQTNPTTLENAIARVLPGRTIWVRSGNYKMAQSLAITAGNNGKPGAPKRLFAYNDEVPVFDFSTQEAANANRGVILNGNFWHLRGLTVEHAGDNGIYVGGSNNVVELCETRFNADTGLQIGRASSDLTDISQWPANNLILNCTSHDNKDPGNENADGFACKLTAGSGNIFRGCIAHHNIDDGWDLFAKKETGPIGAVLIEDCIAYSNGALSDGTTSRGGDKNGFKLGGSGIAVPHTVRQCIAFNNGKHGFTDNNNPGPIAVTNNTSFHNTESNFNFRAGGTHVFTGNISFQAGESDKMTGTQTGTSNLFWHNRKGSVNDGGALTVSADDFISLDVPKIVGRKPDGSPDLGNFLRLKPNSDLSGIRLPASSAIQKVAGP